MRYHDLLRETVHHDGNLDLVQYFQVLPFDMLHDERAAEFWMYYVHDYLNDADKARMAKYLSTEIEAVTPGDYYDLPPKAQRQFAEWTLMMPQNARAFYMHDDPLSAPAWMLLEPVTGKLLPKSTFLVHFSDHAAQIKAAGFQQGVPDINRIALTREHSLFDQPGASGQRISYDEPGYNFAYLANGSIDLDLRAGGYGASAILFRSTGMLVHHSGDQEQQVVFWGPAANTKNGIVVERKDHRWISDTGNGDMSLNRLVRRLVTRAPSVQQRTRVPTIPKPVPVPMAKRTELVSR